MPIDHSRLRHEFRHPEAMAILREFVDCMAEETETAEALKAETGVHISLLDLGVLSYVLNWFAIEGAGSRPQSVIDSFRAPRRTIRDGIDRLIEAGLLTKEGPEIVPTEKAIDWMNRRYPRDYTKLERLAEAFLLFREKVVASGR